jgi:hypothetical protein
MNNPIVSSPDSTSTEPVRFCACCGEPVAVLVQEYVYKGRQIAPPVTAYTCQESSCDLYLQTLSANADLSLYNVTAQYDILTGKLLPAYVRFSNCGPESREDRKLRSLLATGRAK